MDKTAVKKYFSRVAKLMTIVDKSVDIVEKMTVIHIIHNNVKKLKLDFEFTLYIIAL